MYRRGHFCGLQLLGPIWVQQSLLRPVNWWQYFISINTGRSSQSTELTKQSAFNHAIKDNLFDVNTVNPSWSLGYLSTNAMTWYNAPCPNLKEKTVTKHTHPSRRLFRDQMSSRHPATHYLPRQENPQHCTVSPPASGYRIEC